MSQAIVDRLNALQDGTSKQLISTISKMTVLELAQFKKDFETVFEVQAAAAVAMAAPGAGGGGGGEAKAEAKTTFDVVLTVSGDKKIQVIKEVRAITNLGLKEAKDLVEGAPKPVKTGVTKEEAEEIKKKLTDVGATVEIK
jgi:large subunit ribosomal protein L7/L12